MWEQIQNPDGTHLLRPVAVKRKSFAFFGTLPMATNFRIPDSRMFSKNQHSWSLRNDPPHDAVQNLFSSLGLEMLLWQKHLFSDTNCNAFYDASGCHLALYKSKRDRSIITEGLHSDDSCRQFHRTPSSHQNLTTDHWVSLGTIRSRWV